MDPPEWWWGRNDGERRWWWKLMIKTEKRRRNGDEVKRTMEQWKIIEALRRNELWLAAISAELWIDKVKRPFEDWTWDSGDIIIKKSV